VNIIESITSGVVQGLTEFLPVSSSGHLVLLHFFFGIKEPQILFDLFLHMGTLAAVLIYFRRDIIEIVSKKRHMLWLVLLGTIPLAFLALLFKFCVVIENGFKQIFVNPFLVGFLLIITGLWLCLPNILKKNERPKTDIRNWQAIVVGLAQALAVLPGISRSGATISTGLLCDLEHKSAARYSFLLSIPAIIGVTIFKFRDINGSIHQNGFWIMIPGFLAALLVGYVAIHLLLKIVYAGRLYFFGFYCFLMGLIVMLGVKYF